jgi:aspartate/methionine/tyrosine aminotransferase
MNTLAIELNDQIKDTVAYRLLSEFGKRFYFPKGIVSQSGEAKKFANRFNATIGMAYKDKQPIILSAIQEQIGSLSSGDSVAYAPTPGVPDLRTVWKDEILRKNPSITDKDGISLPLVVPGLTNGLVQIADLFVEKGDTIIIPDMFWGNYRLMLEVRKEANIVTFPFFNEEGSLNISGLKSTIDSHSSKGKLILILNFPNNPTGYSPTTDEAAKIIEVLHDTAQNGTDLLVASDDAYFGLFFEEGTNTESLFSKLYSLHENILAVKIDGATKEDYVWGFRIGFVTFGSKALGTEQYEALNKKLGGAVRSSVSNSSRIAQTLLLKAMAKKEYAAEKEKTFQLLKDRYIKVKEVLEKRTIGKALKELPFNSGYFMSFKCSGISAEALRKELLNRGIGTIAIGEDYLRVAFASVDLAGIEELYTTIFEAADSLG